MIVTMLRIVIVILMLIIIILLINKSTQMSRQHLRSILQTRHKQ